MGRSPAALEARDELVEAELLEPAADLIQFTGAVLDQLASLAHECERLAQPRVTRVQAAHDLLDASDRRLVGERVAGLNHRR